MVKASALKFMMQKDQAKTQKHAPVYTLPHVTKEKLPFLIAGFDQNSQSNNDGNQSSLDCLSLIVDSISSNAQNTLINNSMSLHERPPL